MTDIKYTLFYDNLCSAVTSSVYNGWDTNDLNNLSSSDRTIYYDSNIAFTSGDKSIVSGTNSDGSLLAVPDLYGTLKGLNTRINDVKGTVDTHRHEEYANASHTHTQFDSLTVDGNLTVSNNVFVSGIICNTTDNRYIKVPRHIDLNNETTKWKTTLHNSENALHIDMFDDKGNWVTKNTLCDASGNALIRGNLNVHKDLIAGRYFTNDAVILGNSIGSDPRAIIKYEYKDTNGEIINNPKLYLGDFNGKKIAIDNSCNTNIPGNLTVSGATTLNTLTVNGATDFNNPIKVWNYVKICDAGADNDFARIRFAGPSNEGSLEIATADDATEPITVSQYTGDFATRKRTLTLLDNKGDTILPGNLTLVDPISGGDGPCIFIGPTVDLRSAENLLNTYINKSIKQSIDTDGVRVRNGDLKIIDGNLIANNNVTVNKALTVNVNNTTNGLYVTKSDLETDATTAVAIGKSAGNHQCGAITFKNSEIPEFGIGFWYHDLIVSCKCTAGQATPDIYLKGNTTVSNNLIMKGNLQFGSTSLKDGSGRLNLNKGIEMLDDSISETKLLLGRAKSSKQCMCMTYSDNENNPQFKIGFWDNGDDDIVLDTNKRLTINDTTTINADLITSGRTKTRYITVKDELNSGKEYSLYVSGGALYYRNDTTKELKTLSTISNGSQTITHETNIFGLTNDGLIGIGLLGTFCESTGEIYDGYEKITNTDCICSVKQSKALNKRIVGIITSETQFASHGDVLVRIVEGEFAVGDILCPDENGCGRVATDEELMFMMLHAIPRPKITSLNTGIDGMVACFLI